jgi:hypothetical protein
LDLQHTTGSGFIVKPIRTVSGGVPSGFSQLYWNSSTGEIIQVTP